MSVYPPQTDSLSPQTDRLLPILSSDCAIFNLSDYPPGFSSLYYFTTDHTINLANKYKTAARNSFSLSTMGK